MTRPTDAPSPGRAVPFLDDVDELPVGRCGSLTFMQEREPLGVILVQERRVCWATARGMRGRMTDILLGQSAGALRRSDVEAVYARCRRDAKPLGESLVEAGVVSAEGLRAALLRHVGEALLKMGSSKRSPPRWEAHQRGTYDARFTFSTSEVYTALCASLHAADAADGEDALRAVLPETCDGVAFVRDGGGRPVAIRGARPSHAADLVELGTWVTSSLDVAQALSDHPGLVVFRAGSDAAALWTHRRCLCVALCSEPSDLSYLVAKRRDGACP